MTNEVNKRFVKTANGEEEVDLSGFAGRVVRSLGKSNIKEVSDFLGIGYDKVYSYLKLRNDPPPEFLVILARFTNRSLLWLLTGEGESFINTRTVEEISEALAQKTNESQFFDLELFVVDFAKRNAKFREMLTDISFRRAEKIAKLIAEMVEIAQEEDEALHQRLVATLKAQYQNANAKTIEFDSESDIKKLLVDDLGEVSDKPRQKRRTKKGRG